MHVDMSAFTAAASPTKMNNYRKRLDGFSTHQYWRAVLKLVLVVAWRRLAVDGKPHLLVPLLVTGCKV
jgi:hypothetical protein